MLCEIMHCTISELLDRMSSYEITEWHAWLEYKAIQQKLAAGSSPTGTMGGGR